VDFQIETWELSFRLPFFFSGGLTLWSYWYYHVVVADKRESPTSVRLDPKMQARLKRIHKEEGGRSVSSIIKQAVQEFISKWEAGRKKKK